MKGQGTQTARRDSRQRRLLVLLDRALYFKCAVESGCCVVLRACVLCERSMFVSRGGACIGTASRLGGSLSVVYSNCCNHPTDA